MSRTGERECPCRSGSPYAACCEPLHDNRVQSVTAEQLMRSRYAGYVLGRLDHVYRTWHPRTRPAQVEPTHGLTWTGLTIWATEAGQPGDGEGVVEFEATYLTPAGPGALHERSRFTRRADRWVYLDGDLVTEPARQADS
jgi:SEC-C motif-containing protein